MPTTAAAAEAPPGGQDLQAPLGVEAVPEQAPVGLAQSALDRPLTSARNPLVPIASRKFYFRYILLPGRQRDGNVAEHVRAPSSQDHVAVVGTSSWEPRRVGVLRPSLSGGRPDPWSGGCYDARRRSAGRCQIPPLFLTSPSADGGVQAPPARWAS